MGESPNVFLSWSGPRSKAMAEALRDWLPRVIQSVAPFFSDKDIETGAFWDDSIKTSLSNTRFAIICCTPENIGAPWLNYEAGALAERMKGGTAPWLLGAKPEALSASPLSRLMARTADESGTLEVVKSLNVSLGGAVPAEILSDAFETYWPKLVEKLEAIPSPSAQPKPPERTERDMLEEVVKLCRQVASERPRRARIDPPPTSLLLPRVPVTDDEAQFLMAWDRARKEQRVRALDTFFGEPEKVDSDPHIVAGLLAPFGSIEAFEEYVGDLLQKYTKARIGTAMPRDLLGDKIAEIRATYTKQGGAKRKGYLDQLIKNAIDEELPGTDVESEPKPPSPPPRT